jgi:hypothetical protein
MTINPNFEVVCNTGQSYCQQYTRYNSEPGYPWSTGINLPAIGGGVPAHVSLILSAPWGNLEAVVVTPQNGIKHYWRNPNDPQGVWNFGVDIGSQIPTSVGAVSGPPSLIQRVSYGETQIGNFELLVPGQFGIVHLTRNNNPNNNVWSYQEDSGFAGGVQGVALIQSDYGTPPGPGELVGGPGNLECVVIDAAQDLVHWYLDPATGMWTRSVTITNLAGTGEADQGNPSPGAGNPYMAAPAFIQPSGGYARSTHGNFEVVVPQSNGYSLGHFYRDNSQVGGEKWSFNQQFGTGWYPALILSTFGNLELVVSGSGSNQGLLAHWYQNAANGNWYQSTVFAPGTDPGLPGFIQDAPPPQVFG